MKKIILFLVIFNFTFASISTVEAKKHIGEYVEVCGRVDGVYHHRNGHLFLNLDGKYPNQKMSVIIWKRYVNEFKNFYFLGKTICIKGVVKEYKGTPEIFLKNRYQVKFK
jgi:exonuclease VII large subunit